MPRLEQVGFGYDLSRPVLSGFSLDLPEAGTVCLLGPSGCGKTTLLRLLAGLAVPQSGRIVGLDGRPAAVVFQEDRLLPWETAWQNAVTRPDDGQRERARDWLVRLGLGESLHRRPGELSGGMKRRVAMARALASDAELLLLDEPFTGLDETAWRQAADLLSGATDENRLTVLVTHLPEQAAALGAAVVRLDGPPLRRLS
ncbi:MAG: ABC transporter ATP-binding protein [Actinobacteria bacterium HGW-Actinobacteria-5]|jgi:NitT/TauT family transport system ATP-binding protein|nr:MAG: ABC transporter ATP-binding protein [Actinobacteria bacterium HGW-Actinobacteria-5]